MLHYFLTGDAASRETVIDSAQWVIDMDDGTQDGIPLAGSRRHRAGDASGRYRLPRPGARPGQLGQRAARRAPADRRRRRFLDKAERAHPPRASIRPRTSPAATCSTCREPLVLHDVPAVARASTSTTRSNAASSTRCTPTRARACCTTRAGWPSTSGRTSSSRRSSSSRPKRGRRRTSGRATSSICAAQHADGRRARALSRAGGVLLRLRDATLAGMPTRTLARPVILLLSNGWLRSWIEGHPDAQTSGPDDPVLPADGPFRTAKAPSDAAGQADRAWRVWCCFFCSWRCS